MCGTCSALRNCSQNKYIQAYPYLILQAREDARLAVAAYAAQHAQGPAQSHKLPGPGTLGGLERGQKEGLAGAYLRLGEALLATPGHPDRDAAGAAQVSSAR